MSSYYGSNFEAETVPVPGFEEGLEVPCKRCYGTGLVWIQDQETDCIDCEGMGSVILS